MKLHPNLEAVRQLMPGLAQTLGANCEVVLHDLSHLDCSIVAMEGNITGRHVGDSATNYLISMVQKYGDDTPDCINYKTMLPDNRVLRSSTLYLHDDSGHLVGAVCINRDITHLMTACRELERQTHFEEDLVPQLPEAGEVFNANISSIMETLVNTEMSLSPHAVAYMQKDEKLRLVSSLDARGVFDVKGAVEYVASRLGVTNYTIYNYLKEIKGGRLSEVD